MPPSWCQKLPNQVRGGTLPQLSAHVATIAPMGESEEEKEDYEGIGQQAET